MTRTQILDKNGNWEYTIIHDSIGWWFVFKWISTISCDSVRKCKKNVVLNEKKKKIQKYVGQFDWGWLWIVFDPHLNWRTAVIFIHDYFQLEIGETQIFYTTWIDEIQMVIMCDAFKNKNKERTAAGRLARFSLFVQLLSVIYRVERNLDFSGIFKSILKSLKTVKMPDCVRHGLILMGLKHPEPKFITNLRHQPQVGDLKLSTKFSTHLYTF